jgi:hypothetical protein
MAAAIPALALDRSNGDIDPRSGLPQLTASNLFFEKGTIILSRPLHELWAHATHCQLPSWSLLARSVYTLFMAIFRWHFCDGILLLRGEGLYHSFNGHTETINATGRRTDRLTGAVCPHFTPEDLAAFEARSPHLLESARWLKCRDNLPTNEGLRSGHPQRPIELAPGTPPGTYATWGVIVPNLIGYAEITAQTVREYFHNYCRKDITDQAEGNTLDTLVYSDRLRLAQVHIPR